nr:hypothetical protein [Tanacetum cinerariifolium]
MAFVSSSNNNNTNEAVNTTQVVNTAIGVSTVGTQVNTTNIDNLSDAVICAFLASQLSSSQLVNKDLEQIYPDDLEEMCDGKRDVNVNETFYEQTDGELSERELKQIEADDQAI